MTPLERAGYIAHGRTAAHRNKVARAMSLIAEHRDYAVSISWGKDSGVMLHMAAMACPTIRVINIRYPHWAERLADHDRVRDEMLARPEMAAVRYIELPAPGMWQAYEKFGIHDNDTTGGRAATAWFDRQFNAAFEAVEGAGHIVGMRAGESQRRAWNILKRGVHYQRQDGRRMLLPLAGWSGKDVWAYTATHGLPYLRIYDHAIYDRDRQRSEIALSSTQNRRLHAQGEFQAWQMCYPAEFQAWCDRWPELAYS